MVKCKWAPWKCCQIVYYEMNGHCFQLMMFALDQLIQHRLDWHYLLYHVVVANNMVQPVNHNCDCPLFVPKLLNIPILNWQRQSKQSSKRYDPLYKWKPIEITKINQIKAFYRIKIFSVCYFSFEIIINLLNRNKFNCFSSNWQIIESN